MAAGIVGSVFAQEALSRGVSHVLAKLEERSSMEDTLERLEWAHSELAFVLERSSKLPITDVSLLGQRRSIKRVYHQCDELWRNKRRALNNNQEAEQGIITIAQSSSSFPVVKNFALTAVRSISSFFGMKKDELSRSTVRRFELFADKAGKFMRDVESGCSLAHYRFFNPFITQLLQGIALEYKMVQAGRIHDLFICPVRSEEHGVVALLWFYSHDKITEKSFSIQLLLRLSEDMDILRIAIGCLQSLGPQFKPLTQFAIGELSQLPTQDLSHSHTDHSSFTSYLVGTYRPDPLCCIANQQRPCADNVIPPELSHRFPEQVIDMSFNCEFLASDYNMQVSASEYERNDVNDWEPLLSVFAHFMPHYVDKNREMYAWERIGKQEEHMNVATIQRMEEMVLTNAITCFLSESELTIYGVRWASLHGAAGILVQKTEEMFRQETT